MSIAGLATYQNRSMYYSVRNGSGNYDFGNGGSFMNQMLAFHREDSGVSQTEEGNRTSVDSDISSELQSVLLKMLKETGNLFASRAMVADEIKNNAASKWYMYDNGSKRYTFEEFCKFMDAKDAEARANAPEFKNPYLEMANYILNQRKKEA